MSVVTRGRSGDEKKPEMQKYGAPLSHAMFSSIFHIDFFKKKDLHEAGLITIYSRKCAKFVS